MLRNVDDECIHFTMSIKRFTDRHTMSRISPAVWEAFYDGFQSDADNNGLEVIVIKVDKGKRSLAERLGLANKSMKVGNTPALPRTGGGSEAQLPVYSPKATE